MRIKRGIIKKAKRRKVLKSVKGYRMAYRTLYQRAREAQLHAGQYSYSHRKKRAGDFKKIWIQKINAALSDEDLSYSKFIHLLATNKIELNKKMLATLALEYPQTFKEIVKSVK